MFTSPPMAATFLAIVLKSIEVVPSRIRSDVRSASHTSSGPSWMFPVLIITLMSTLGMTPYCTSVAVNPFESFLLSFSGNLKSWGCPPSGGVCFCAYMQVTKSARTMVRRYLLIGFIFDAFSYDQQSLHVRRLRIYSQYCSIGRSEIFRNGSLYNFRSDFPEFIF